jgi:hypothetical protein
MAVKPAGSTRKKAGSKPAAKKSSGKLASVTLPMKFEKPTTNKLRFAESNEDSGVPTIYIDKALCAKLDVGEGDEIEVEIRKK